MQAFLLINTLFKTIEYRLETPNNLKITELSSSGSPKSKNFSLSSVSVEEGQTTPSYLPWLVIILGLGAIASVIYSSQSSAILQNNLMSAVSFLLCVFTALALICRPIKSHIYRDSFSNNVLFKMSNYSMSNHANYQFINDLNASIEAAKEVESNRINLKSNAKRQYEIHNKNVDELLNSGLIDEALYNRICNSMHEKVFGRSEEQHYACDNVIYLNQ